MMVWFEKMTVNKFKAKGGKGSTTPAPRNKAPAPDMVRPRPLTWSVPIVETRWTWRKSATSR